MKFIKSGPPITVGIILVNLLSQCHSAPSPTDEVVFYEDAKFDGRFQIN